RFLFVDSELATLVKPGQVEHTVNIVDDASFQPLPGPTYEEFLAGGAAEPQPSYLDTEYDTLSINYTSGTTGRPKGVMYHHRGAYMNAFGPPGRARRVVDRQRVVL